MDRREMFGILGALGAGAGLGTYAHADHDAKVGQAMMASPVGGMAHHFCGIHVAKNNPKIQMIVQHYCGQQSDALHQCLLFDSSEKNAKLIGVEYIVTNEVFQAFDDKEKRFWHPHTYEVLAGGLIAPAMKPDDEMGFMKYILTTWGKTWHTWPDPESKYPVGEPMLMWAITGDGQVSPEIVAKRDKMFNVKCDAIRDKRIKAIGFEVPQIPFPTSIDQVGRQWTKDGEDKPRKVQ
jgi:Protein of unknown function (DUF1264)